MAPAAGGQGRSEGVHHKKKEVYYMKKKLLGVFTAVCMTVSLTACAGGGAPSPTTETGGTTAASEAAGTTSGESQTDNAQADTTAASQPAKTGGGALSIPEDVAALIANRAKGAPDEVLAFYDSWSAREMKEGKKPGEGFTVAVGTGDLYNDTALFGFWGTVKYLEEMGCNVIYNVGPGSYAPENAQVFENFVAQNPDAIMWQFANSQLLGSGIEKAGQRNIPVFGLDNALSGPTVIGEVTSDNFEIGRIAANYIVNKTGGEAKGVEVFATGHRGIEIRHTMWDLITKEHPGIEEVSEIPWTSPDVLTSTRDRMDAALEANPDAGSIRFVHANYDLPGMACADAIEAAGRQDEIFVIGIDGDREAMQRIAGGSCFEATVSQDFMLMAFAISHQIVDYLNEKEVPRFLYCPPTLVTKDNVAEVYKFKYGEDLK